MFGPKFSPSKQTLPEWSKGVDSSSTSANCVGSNPTGVIWLHSSSPTPTKKQSVAAAGMLSGAAAQGATTLSRFHVASFKAENA